MPDSQEEGQAQTPAPPREGTISAVVPSFNDARRIRDTLAAIAGQTLRPIEVVVCDDASDDDTEQVVARFAAEHAGELPVRYLRQPERGGVVAARNRAIEATSGEWIATCDSDDVWAPNRLERQTEVVSNWTGKRRIALIGSYGLNMNDAGKVISPARMGPTNEAEYDAIRREGRLFFVIHSSALYARADFDAVGGYTTEYGAADDFHFFCLMAERGVVVNVPEPLVYYRKRSGSVQLARFWDQQLNVQRLSENERRRVRGEPPIGAEEFEARLASASAWGRFKRGRKLRGMYYYRVGATNMVNGHRVRGGAYLALSSVLDGARLRSGVRRTLRAGSSNGR